jgi:hypothetical protein
VNLLLWLCNLSYLTDIFEKLNELNTSLQGETANVLLLHNKITAFVKKISIRKQKVVNGNIDMFLWTNDFIEENELGLEVIKKRYPQSSNHLGNSIREIFSNRLGYRKTRLDTATFQRTTRENTTLTAQEELAELSSDRTLQLVFLNKDMCDFWLTVKNEYPVVAELAIRVLLPFATSYLCESAFYALTYINHLRLSGSYMNHLL